MSDYRVAAYPARPGQRIGATPEGKNHAFLPGAKATVCGFGLSQMQSFKDLRFTEQPSSARCSMCDQRIRAAGR